ncbi:hypothetical protein ACFQ1S_03325 [Kibdelosporangium lantanae]|uniref:Uncharacterized protein n=1 Tax=Kibdelosporangium lantanae TaxID=1497396 RepID=A0ABW3M518_9PSEU
MFADQVVDFETSGFRFVDDPLDNQFSDDSPTLRLRHVQRRRERRDRKSATIRSQTQRAITTLFDIIEPSVTRTEDRRQRRQIPQRHLGHATGRVGHFFEQIRERQPGVFGQHVPDLAQRDRQPTTASQNARQRLRFRVHPVVREIAQQFDSAVPFERSDIDETSAHPVNGNRGFPTPTLPEQHFHHRFPVFSHGRERFVEQREHSPLVHQPAHRPWYLPGCRHPRLPKAQINHIGPLVAQGPLPSDTGHRAYQRPDQHGHARTEYPRSKYPQMGNANPACRAQPGDPRRRSTIPIDSQPIKQRSGPSANKRVKVRTSTMITSCFPLTTVRAHR